MGGRDGQLIHSRDLHAAADTDKSDGPAMPGLER